MPAGYALQWSGQFENMLRVRAAAQGCGAADAFNHIHTALHKHKKHRQNRHCDARGAVFADWGYMVFVYSRLQYLDSGLGRNDSPDGA